MAEQKWERKKHIIIKLTGPGDVKDEILEFESINAAKRESWRLQMKNSGGLGRGDLRTRE